MLTITQIEGRSIGNGNASTPSDDRVAYHKNSTAGFEIDSCKLTVGQKKKKEKGQIKGTKGDGKRRERECAKYRSIATSTQQDDLARRWCSGDGSQRHYSFLRI